MKIIASGDHHFDQHRKLDECIRVHAWIADLVRREQADVFVSGGDIYERASTPTEREAVAEWLCAVAEVCPVVIAKGNHDRPFDAFWLRRLRSKHPIIVEERAAVHVVAGAAIATVAWPSRSALAAMAGGDAAGTDAAASGALDDILRGLGAELAAHPGPRLLLGHFMIDGSVVSTGQEMLGAEMNVGLTSLALAGADAVVAAHIHRSQRFEIGGKPVWYPGSPFRQNYGEMEPKSVLLLEWGTDGLVREEQIPTPCTPMHHVDDEWGLLGDDMGELAGKMGWLAGAHGLPRSCSGAEIRFRYRVASEFRDQARAAAQRWRDEWLAEGALSVKCEEQVIATTRSRTPDVARATTLADKLSALWEARKDVPTPSRREAMMVKLSTLEGAS